MLGERAEREETGQLRRLGRGMLLGQEKGKAGLGYWVGFWRGKGGPRGLVGFWGFGPLFLYSF